MNTREENRIAFATKAAIMFKSFMIWGSSIVFLAGALLLGAEERNLAEYRPLSKAIRMEKTTLEGASQNKAGKLGLRLSWKPGVGAIVVEVQSDSPSAKAGIQSGDVVELVRGKKIQDEETMRLIHTMVYATEKTEIQLRRSGVEKMVELIPMPWSRPLANTPRARMGISLQKVKDKDAVEVKSVTPNGPGEKAGVKVGDILSSINGKKIRTEPIVTVPTEGKKAGDELMLLVERQGKQIRLKLRLESDQLEDTSLSWNDRDRKLFRKPVYKLAVLLVEFPDQKMNDKIKPSDWEKQLFSFNEYNTENATGQKAYGSMNDYYHEISYGQLKIAGKAYAPVALSKKRIEYSTASPRNQIMEQTLDKFFEREGANSLDGYDGVFFMYAGSRAPVVRGNVLWPHRGNMSYKGKRYSYFICPEGGEKMFPISVMAHEFGHLLGLPDLYARPEVPDMEGLGMWCTMANGAGLDGRPVHFSAWCKEQMGWIKPVIVDPRVRQKLILSPVETASGEFLKIPVRPDGNEYFLLENRMRKGYDKMLQAEGLFIWRVVDGKPSLEESHGIPGQAGPGRYPDQVPYPSRSNRDFTPLTVPSSSPVKQGGWPLHITQIERLPDGRLLLQIGYEYY